MVAERRSSSPENYAYLALLFSLLRPELQGYLKLGQDAVNPAIASISNPYNLTGLAFSGTLPYSHGTNYGTNISIDNFITSKERVGVPDYYDPLSQYSDWQPNAQFNNSGIAMILGDTQVDTQVRSHLGSFDSGYSSSEEASSPLSTSSFNSHSPTRQPWSPLDDNLGAVGYTPPSGSDDYVHSLEDYVDLELEYLANGEATKGNFDFIQDLPLALKQEPDYLLDKLLSPESLTYSTDFKTSPDGSYFPDDFHLGLETKEFDPFEIDFDQTITNSSLQYPLGNDLDAVIDFDALDSLDFSLPPDILTTTENIYPTNIIQSQLQDLIQNPVPVRNDPNGLKTVSALDNANKLTSIPTTSTGTTSNKNKFAVSTKAPAAAKKLTATKSKSISSENLFAEISDEGIIDMPVSEFNTFLESLPEEQARYVRDVRRRGKNKEAARVCRKRKLDAIDDIDEELKKIKLEKQKVLDDQRAILEETAALKSKISELETSLFNSLQDDHGQPLSVSEYSLYQGTNGAVYIGKNIDNKQQQQKKST